jgi:hypothetical protein
VKVAIEQSVKARNGGVGYRHSEAAAVVDVV